MKDAPISKPSLVREIVHGESEEREHRLFR
jgi:hypothetical protein